MSRHFHMVSYSNHVVILWWMVKYWELWWFFGVFFPCDYLTTFVNIVSYICILVISWCFYWAFFYMWWVIVIWWWFDGVSLRYTLTYLVSCDMTVPFLTNHHKRFAKVVNYCDMVTRWWFSYVAIIIRMITYITQREAIFRWYNLRAKEEKRGKYSEIQWFNGVYMYIFFLVSSWEW